MVIQLISKGSLPIGASSYDGNALDIYPYIAESVTTQHENHLGITIHLINTLDIYPYITETITTQYESHFGTTIHLIDTMRITK